MRTEQKTFRGYEIQVTNNPALWQAAIYRTNPTLPEIDWVALNIRATGVSPAFQEAKQVINRALGRRQRGKRPPLLPQGHGRGQAIDFVNLGNRHLMKKTPRIGETDSRLRRSPPRRACRTPATICPSRTRR